ncbi:acetyltransferase [Salisediminibacterium halotolerans]|uniref:acetyltransferase n=1 Tax=Salisediminibacterium halotolerans TaxID=517425 RepID=UPI000EABCB65|nr:acetyltransferase [Salisediminibacterium halotolerans]RLJ75725.1 sugar O-acyltransferase (sialic acid O-acetyltransferase NeuD family) [Actinophytocola xinjiangensis]RPE89579.1 sugar O-acyltransferase (sialic acid O-acetyltransferase NeuD family) [Salisediminibacterium halotolerans]TWG36338.1 sugar O-acyltransferase (sialic acid O-acetyltransferase NeuD family) [Salisediminibacterium halotolerans]GEL07213.1 acetyltransferase [Salisediminibacterium halotolerans]
MNEKLIIIGASGHGKVAADVALKMKMWKNIYFLDDAKGFVSSLNLDVIGPVKDVRKYIRDADIFVAIGDNRVRRSIQERIEIFGANVPVLIHPSAVVGSEVEINAGSILMAGAIINSSTAIGKGVIVNTGASIDHDNVIEDYVHIAPGVHLAGSIKIGQQTFIGIGSTVKNNVQITGECVIGAGSLVIKNIVEKGTYIGTPAKKMQPVNQNTVPNTLKIL